MGDFFIGKTNFGVDAKKSRFDVAKAADGRLVLTVEIDGDEEIHKKLTANPGSKWSWTLYPPQFYLRNYPLAEKARGKEHKITLKPADSEIYDVALYLMEHNNVAGVTIKLNDTRIEIAGQVDLMGEPQDFRIVWQKAAR